MAPIVHEFKLDKKYEIRVCVTAQHRQMLDQVLNIFNITPDYDLDLMQPGQSLTDITCKFLKSLEAVLTEFMPDWIFVHGDTTTTFSASLAAFYKKIKIAHVEAGLRTFNINSPWPEEFNRQMTSKIASLHLTPTTTAKSNLLKEGVPDASIFVTGNSVIDSLISISKKIDGDQFLLKKLEKNFEFLDPTKKLILVTGHRRENFGLGFEAICNALIDISKIKDVQIVYPVHLNPNIHIPANRILSNISNIYLIEPQDYIPFVYLMKRSYLILTDSGGIQEEAPSLGKPVILMRENTERPEAVFSGCVQMVGSNRQSIFNAAYELLTSKKAYDDMAKIKNPYGDGKTAKLIRKIFDKFNKI